MNITGRIHSIDSPELESIISLDQSYFPYPWNRQQWLEMNLSTHQIYTYQVEGQIIGFALFGLLAGDDTAHLYKVLIEPRYQGQGFSSSFWSEIHFFLKNQDLKKVYLEVEVTNEKAINFYKKIGFTTLRRARGHYSNGGDGLMLQLTL